MNSFIKERNLIVSKLLGNEKEDDFISKSDKDFLINYFQFQENIEKTYIFYPVKIADEEILFKKRKLFGKNKEKNLRKILGSDIIGIMYFYANFKKDMSFSSSEKLCVNIFLQHETSGDLQKNISYIKDLSSANSPLLQKICQKYYSQAN